MVFDKIRINENSIYIGEGFFCYHIFLKRCCEELVRY